MSGDALERLVHNLSEWRAVSSKVERYFDKGESDPLNIRISRHKQKRSNKQNRYYWGVVIENVARYYEKNPSDLLRDLILAVKADFSPTFIHEMMKMLFNDGSNSTASNNTEQMEEYHGKIREHFLHEYQLDIPEPEENLSRDEK